MSNIDKATLESAINADIEPEKPVLNILYQDEFMVAVDKPAGFICSSKLYG